MTSTGPPKQTTKSQPVPSTLSTISSQINTKAISGFFSSVATKIQKVVDEPAIKNLLGNDNQKQKPAILLLPWDDFPEGLDPKIKAEVRTQIINLTKSKRNFLNAPPEDANFVFDFEKILPVAQLALQADKNLSNARFYLVPKYIREPKFWRNYFYRVYIIKQAYGLSKVGTTTPLSNLNLNLSPTTTATTTTTTTTTTLNSNSNSNSSPAPQIQTPASNVNVKEENNNTPEDKPKEHPNENETIPEVDNEDEFVSDNFEFEKEMRAEIDEKNLEISDEWEAQMKQELEE